MGIILFYVSIINMFNIQWLNKSIFSACPVTSNSLKTEKIGTRVKSPTKTCKGKNHMEDKLEKEFNNKNNEIQLEPLLIVVKVDLRISSYGEKNRI